MTKAKPTIALYGNASDFHLFQVGLGEALLKGEHDVDEKPSQLFGSSAKVGSGWKR
jgi:hypothetical protein